jgi:hypothetical protein
MKMFGIDVVGSFAVRALVVVGGARWVWVRSFREQGKPGG